MYSRSFFNDINKLIIASYFFSEFRAQYCLPFNLKLKPSTSKPTQFREIFRKSPHHVNTNKGSVVKQSGNNIEGCRSQKVLFQPNMRVFLQYSVKSIENTCHRFSFIIASIKNSRRKSVSDSGYAYVTQ